MLTCLFLTDMTNIDAHTVSMIANKMGPKFLKNSDRFNTESTADFHESATVSDKACIINSSNISRKVSSSAIEGAIYMREKNHHYLGFIFCV